MKDAVEVDYLLSDITRISISVGKALTQIILQVDKAKKFSISFEILNHITFDNLKS